MRILSNSRSFIFGFLLVTTCVAAFGKKKPQPVSNTPTTTSLTAKEAAKEAARDFWERSLPGKMVAPPDATSPSIEKLEGKLISVKRKRRKQLETDASTKPTVAVKPVKEKKVKAPKVPKVKPVKEEVSKVKPVKEKKVKAPKVKPVKVPKVKPVKVPKVKKVRRKSSSRVSTAKVLKAGAKSSVFAAGATASSLSLMPLVTEGYSRAQAAFMIDFDKLVFPQVTSGVREICIVFHGAEGATSENIEKLMRQLKKRRVVKKKRRKRGDNDDDDTNDAPTAFLMDWSEYCSNTHHTHPAQASFCAERIGKEVAKRLPYRLTKLHVIGIGVGAAAANACVVQLKKSNRNHHLYIQETLLDPNCARGLLDVEYGLREFGKKADYAQQFVASDNHSTICTKCAILNVQHTTSSSDDDGNTNDDWALEYYNAHVQELGFVDDMKKFGRGVVRDATAAAAGE